MRSVRVVAVCLLVLPAMLLSSCCCGRGLARKQGVASPTGSGGTVTVKPGGAGDKEDTVLATGKGGAKATTLGSVDQATLDKVGLPVYPGAEGRLSVDTVDAVSASFTVSASFDDVLSWCERELGPGWRKSTMGGEPEIATLTSESQKTTVAITEANREVRISVTKLTPRK